MSGDDLDAGIYMLILQKRWNNVVSSMFFSNMRSLVYWSKLLLRGVLLYGCIVYDCLHNPGVGGRKKKDKRGERKGDA